MSSSHFALTAAKYSGPLTSTGEPTLADRSGSSTTGERIRCSIRRAARLRGRAWRALPTSRFQMISARRFGETKSNGQAAGQCEARHADFTMADRRRLPSTDGCSIQVRRAAQRRAHPSAVAVARLSNEYHLLCAADLRRVVTRIMERIGHPPPPPPPRQPLHRLQLRPPSHHHRHLPRMRK